MGSTLAGIQRSRKVNPMESGPDLHAPVGEPPDIHAHGCVIFTGQ